MKKQTGISESPWLKIPQAAQEIGMHETYVRNLIEEGKLLAYGHSSTGGVRKHWRIHRRDFDHFLASCSSNQLLAAALKPSGNAPASR